MPVIHTKRNMVAAYEPLPSDAVVMTCMGTVRAFEHITRYEAATREAVSMADQMELPVCIVPMGIDEFVELKTGMPMADWLARLPAATLEEFRQLAIEACSDALRYCDDPTVRAEAAIVLVKLGVLKG